MHIRLTKFYLTLFALSFSSEGCSDQTQLSRQLEIHDTHYISDSNSKLKSWPLIVQEGYIVCTDAGAFFKNGGDIYSFVSIGLGSRYKDILDIAKPDPELEKLVDDIGIEAKADVSNLLALAEELCSK